jgi:hypothetical protein
VAVHLFTGEIILFAVIRSSFETSQSSQMLAKAFDPGKHSADIYFV